MIVTNNKIDLKCIKVRKPYTLDNKLHFDINYQDDSFRGPLYIQSPIGILPYRYNLYSDKYFQVDLQISCFEFHKLMNSINKTILNKVKSWCNINNYIENTTFRFYNYNCESINVFDSNAKPIPLNTIVKHDKVYVLFQVEKLIYSKETEKINIALKILQIKRVATVLTKCMIAMGAPPPPPPPGPPPPPPPPQPIFKLTGVSKALPSSIKKQAEKYKPPSLKEILEAKSKLKKSPQINYDI
jgi:hypothetical protein